MAEAKKTTLGVEQDGDEVKAVDKPVRETHAPRHAAPARDEAKPAVGEEGFDLIDSQREQLRKEAEGKEDVSGPADNFTGDASEDPSDHMHSVDPYKKAFPPGPDDPRKL